MRCCSACRVTIGFAIALLLLLCSPSPAAPPGADANELSVKAAFVVNFVRLITWPQDQPEQELVVCALSNSEFLEEVRSALSGKQIGGSSVAVKIDPAPDSARCRVLVLDTSDYRAARPLLKTLTGAPILTIGNGSGFVDIGSMFELTLEDRRVQFNASLKVIQQSKLNVSARLLRLAKEIKTGPNGGS